MSILATLSRFAADHRARRRQLRTYMEISKLPNEIRKDIGWPDTFTDGRARSAAESVRQNY